MPLLNDTPATGKIDEQDLKAADQLKEVYGKLRQELSRTIIGQSEVLKQVLIALFCQGHCVLEGVPGVSSSAVSELSNVNPWP